MPRKVSDERKALWMMSPTLSIIFGYLSIHVLYWAWNGFAIKGL